jgi:hypothetical protein
MVTPIRALQTPILRHLPGATKAQVAELSEGRPSPLPKRIPCAFQRKYDIDAHSPRWKRFLFHWVYAPFVEFFFVHLNFVPWDKQEPDGSYSWLEVQGAYLDQWRAEQEAAKYPFGYTLELVLNEDQPAETVAVPQVHPHRPGVYEQVGKQTVPVETSQINRLQKKIAESDELVRYFKTRPVV